MDQQPWWSVDTHSLVPVLEFFGGEPSTESVDRVALILDVYKHALAEPEAVRAHAVDMPQLRCDLLDAATCLDNMIEVDDRQRSRHPNPRLGYRNAHLFEEIATVLGMTQQQLQQECEERQAKSGYRKM